MSEEKKYEPKPFNFKAWKDGAKVQTRDGEEVSQLTYFEGVDIGDLCLAGVSCGIIKAWDKKGLSDSSVGNHPHPSNLVMSPVTRIARFCIDADGLTLGLNSEFDEKFAKDNGLKIHTVEVQE